MKTAITVAVLLALLAFSIDFRSKHHYKKENIMSTTPKKPSKWAAEIAAWGQGATIQVATFNKPEWSDCGAPGNQGMPIFEDAEDVQYRIKPESAAPVYPKSNLTGEEMHTIINKAAGGLFNEFTAIANAAIRRAIDDGQVVVPGSVVNAEFDPDFQEVKAGENYRWMGNTARKWQELYEKAKEAHRREVAQVSSKYSIDAHHAESDIKAAHEKLAHAERVLKANGFTYSPDEGWSIHSGWRGQVFQEKQERITYLEGELSAARRACGQYKGIAQRVGRAVAKHLNRSDITDHEIAAIVLLEKAK